MADYITRIRRVKSAAKRPPTAGGQGPDASPSGTLRRGSASGRHAEEIFKRMHANAVVSLVLQFERTRKYQRSILTCIENKDKAAAVEKTKNQTEDEQPGSPEGNDVPLTRGSSLSKCVSVGGETHLLALSLVNGMGEKECVNGLDPDPLATAKQQRCATTSPFLILDVRPHEDYQKNRITTAQSYPYTVLSRTNQQETPTMLAFKNRAGKIIIIYDECEREAPRVATTLIQRGYSNLCMLTGGLKEAYVKYLNGLVTGKIPPSFMIAATQIERRNSAYGQRSMKRSMSVSAIPTKSELEDQTSVVKLSPSTNVIKSEFSEKDFSVLKEKLQFNLMPKAARARHASQTQASKNRNKKEA